MYIYIIYICCGMSLPNAQVLMGLSRIFEIFDKNTSRCPSSGGWSLEKNITQVGVSLWERWFVSLGYAESTISAILVAFPTILNHFLTTKNTKLNEIDHFFYYEVIPFHLLWPIFIIAVYAHVQKYGGPAQDSGRGAAGLWEADEVGRDTWDPLLKFTRYLSFVRVSYGRHNLFFN